jgi:hypothetical protein
MTGSEQLTAAERRAAYLARSLFVICVTFWVAANEAAEGGPANGHQRRPQW